MPVQLWQTVDGRSWTLRAALVTDSAGLATTTLRPDRGLTYQMRFSGTTTYWPSNSTTTPLAMSSTTTRATPAV